MTIKRPRILYIEKSVAVGGSTISLYELVRGLDKERFEPIVVFYHANPYIKHYQALDVKTVCLPQAVEADSQAATDQNGTEAGGVVTHQRDIGAQLAKIHPWLQITYHAAKEAYLVIKEELPLSRLLVGVIRQEQIDLIHANANLYGNRDAVIAARLTKKPIVCHVRTLRGFSRFERYLAKSVSTFIYISKAVEELYQQLGIPAEKGKIVYNPIDVDRFDQNGANLRLRTELGLTDQHRLVSNVGRVEWWKGQDYFVEAMAEVIKHEPNARGLIVGQADTSQRSRIYYQRLQGLIQELNLSNYVIETGFRQDVPQIMAASDVIVHSASEPEPFGRVVVEAMAAGRPVIATAAGGVLDIIEDQVNGRLIPCKDATAMATAICEFLRDLGLSERIGQQAKQDAKRRFSVAQHVTVVQQIYDKLLDMPGKVSVVAGD